MKICSFFFSSRRRHTRSKRDWSSDVCSSDLSKLQKEAKEKMAMASLQAGLAFSNAILGAVHGMSHAIGGKFLLPHGDVNGILLPHVMEFNYIAAPEKFARIAKLLARNPEFELHEHPGKVAVSYVKELAY